MLELAVTQESEFTGTHRVWVLQEQLQKDVGAYTGPRKGMDSQVTLDDPRLLFISERMILDADEFRNTAFLLEHARPIAELTLLADPEGQLIGFTTA